MALKNYYQIMEVAPEASLDEIKKAYRNLAKQYHPDRNRGEPAKEERLKEINEAYQVLGDETARKTYDLMIKSQGEPGLSFGPAEAGVWASVFQMFKSDGAMTRGAFCPRRGFGKRGCGRRGGRFFKNGSS